MGDLTVRVQGARELRRAIGSSVAELADLKALHKESAELVAAEARTRVPVRSGALRSSIKASGTKTKAIVRAASTGKSKPYGARQHWAQQQGRPGDQFVYKAMGAKGRQVVKMYVDKVEELVHEMNRPARSF